MELYQINQFLAFAECGNISKAAQQVHTSQPALSRAMKHLEEELGVPLFTRTKNTIALNEYGKLAVQYAKDIELSVNSFKTVLQDTYRMEHSINIASVAPSPLWDLIPQLSSIYPDKNITSSVEGSEAVRRKLDRGEIQIAVLAEPIVDDNYICRKYGTEHLYFSAPKGHKFEKRKSLKFKDIDGETMLLMSEIGFWHEIHEKMMPNSRFLLQNSRDDFSTLVNSSQLPSFSTDVTQKRTDWKSDRTDIPITDKEALATYYVVFHKRDKNSYAFLI
ncbi:MAG: LysR family transcriptional regulator [Spirochaetia bacterium]|nr:LysR family transcriptional regulator [Spirochaetia bacterium]